MYIRSHLHKELAINRLMKRIAPYVYIILGSLVLWNILNILTLASLQAPIITYHL